MALFLVIKGAFDKVPIATIFKALRKKNIDDTIKHRIKNFLSCRYINVSLGGDDLTVHANTGYSQGSVLSSILCCLVIDSLLEDLKSINLFCMGYADDVVNIVRGKINKQLVIINW